MPIDISIVVPAHNPQDRILSRTLAAIRPLCTSESAAVECVIVDNGSTPPLRDRAVLKQLLHDVPRARVVREETLGLTFARLAGFRETSGETIVVFDDDNVPAPTYIDVVRRCTRDYPFVGVWGPGNVEVELLDPVPPRRRQRVKAHHGEKKSDAVRYGCIPGAWYPFYPPGMGQVIRRNVADAYARAVEAGSLDATDRRGASLASAGDNQIVWQAIGMGLAAGLHPELRLLHLIPGHRTTTKYLRRLTFSCATSHCRALAQSFPDQAELWRRNVPTSAWYGLHLTRVVALSAMRDRGRFLSIDLAESLGEMCGHLDVAGYDGHWTQRLARRLGLT